MSKWILKVEPFHEVLFEVLETDTKWKPSASIEATPGRDYNLGDEAGDRVTVNFNSGESIVTFEPYARDERGKAHASLFRFYNEPDFPRSWRLETEAGEGVDWNDYVVRVHVAKVDEERIEHFRHTLEELSYDIPTVEN